MYYRHESLLWLTSLRHLHFWTTFGPYLSVGCQSSPALALLHTHGSRSYRPPERFSHVHIHPSPRLCIRWPRPIIINIALHLALVVCWSFLFSLHQIFRHIFVYHVMCYRSLSLLCNCKPTVPTLNSGFRSTVNPPSREPRSTSMLPGILRSHPSSIAIVYFPFVATSLHFTPG